MKRDLTLLYRVIKLVSQIKGRAKKDNSKFRYSLIDLNLLQFHQKSSELKTPPCPNLVFTLRLDYQVAQPITVATQ